MVDMLWCSPSRVFYETLEFPTGTQLVWTIFPVRLASQAHPYSAVLSGQSFLCNMQHAFSVIFCLSQGGLEFTVVFAMPQVFFGQHP
jgi:hypothetical protein